MTEATETEEAEVFKLAPFNPSSEQIQEKAMDLLNLNDQDVLFDLGCGDGRLLIKVARTFPKIRCVGVEIDPVFATRAQHAVKELDEDLQDRLDIRLEDVLKLPMTSSSKNVQSMNLPTSQLTLMDDATALYLFVLPKGIHKLMPLLDALVASRQKSGHKFRVLSYMFKIHDWEPTRVDKTSKGGCPIYLYEFNF